MSTRSMPRHPAWGCLVLLSAVFATACHHDDNATVQAPVAQSTATTAAPAATTGEPAVTMRYACDANTRVEVRGAKLARALLPDGRQVDMTMVADSSPPVYAGGSLYFKISGAQAHLSQEDGSNELACRPQ